MDVPPLAQIERDVAGEIEGVAPLGLFQRDLVHRPALHELCIPVDEDAALHISAAHKAGAVDAAARLAAPAVLGAQILLGLFGQRIAERLLAAAEPAVNGAGDQLFRLAALGLGKGLVKGPPRFLREDRRHRKAHRFQRHIPDIAAAAIHQPHLGPARVSFRFRVRQTAQHRAAFQLCQPDALHLGQGQHVGGPARQHQFGRKISPQFFFVAKIQFGREYIPVVAVKCDHFGHGFRQGDPVRRHAAGLGAHLTHLPVQPLVPDGGHNARIAFLRRLRQVVNGHDRPCKHCKFHPSGTSNSSSSSSGFMDRMAPSALPVTVSAKDCLACCNATIFSSMVSCAMSLYTCTGFCWPMR